MEHNAEDRAETAEDQHPGRGLVDPLPGVLPEHDQAQEQHEGAAGQVGGRRNEIEGHRDSGPVILRTGISRPCGGSLAGGTSPGGIRFLRPHGTRSRPRP